jgi:folate-binding protein YgfZ
MLAHLPSRGVLAISGPDRISFLNGLVSNEVTRATPGNAVWAALLSPQGRYLIDFFIFSDGDTLFLDAPAAGLDDLQKRLSRYRLRAAVVIENVSATRHVHAAWNQLPPEIPITAPDPRLPEAGFRMLSKTILPTAGNEAAYHAHRHTLGLPDGPPDLEPDKTLLLEANFDALNGVDFQKGCYMGQELTARTKYRGLIKRRLIPIALESSAPPPGTPILAEGTEVGTIRSSSGTLALATLRLDALQKPLITGSSLVTPRIPPWMNLTS